MCITLTRPQILVAPEPEARAWQATGSAMPASKGGSPNLWAGGRGHRTPPAPTDPGVTVSRHRALLTSRSERTNQSPMCEQAGFSLEEPGPPPLEPLVGPQPPVLLPSPAPQGEADAPEEGIHLRPVVPAVVVHPPGDDGVQPSRQVVQRQVGAPVNPQSAEPVACGRWPRPAGTPPSPSAWESQTACPWALACSLDSSRGRSPG